MRIGELATATGVSPRLLRYYEEQNLLRPVRLPNGYRQYSDSDVAAVRHIRILLTAGLPTAVIVRLLDCVEDEGDQIVPSLCPGMMNSLHQQRRRVDETIVRLEESRQALDALLATAVMQDRQPR